MIRRKRGTLAPWLPWRYMVNESTIRTRDDGFMKCVYLVPRDVETSGATQIDVYHKQLGHLFARLGDGWSEWIDEWRWREPYVRPAFDFDGIEAAQLVDRCLRAKIETKDAHVFAASVYLTLKYTPQRTDGYAGFVLGDTKAVSNHATINRFEAACAEFLLELGQILGDSHRVQVLQGAALGSYISQCVNYEPHPAFLPSGWIAEALGSAIWITGLRPKVGRNHLRTIEFFSIAAIDAETLDPIRMLPFNTRLAVRAESMHRDAQRRYVSELIGAFNLRRKNWIARAVQHFTRREQEDTNLTATVQKMDAEELKIQIDMATAGFAKITVNVHTWAGDEATADAQAEQIETELKNAGFRAEIATLNATFAPLSDIPGNGGTDREIPALMAQITRLAPFTGITVGSELDGKWDGPALLVGRSIRGIPVNFALHAPGYDVGNTVLLGQSGGGKSFLMALMALSSLGYRDSRVVYFDSGRSFMAPCLCSGGDWLEPGDGRCAVQPLRNIHDPGQFALAHEWLCRALAVNSVPVTDQVKQALTDAMRLLVRRPLDERTISGLVDLLGGSLAAADGLASYRRTGHHGELLDGVVPGHGSSRLVGIECSALMRMDIAPLVISALFTANRYERMRAGSPFLVFFDEAKSMLIHPAFAAELDFLAREIRKANGVLVMSTQSPGDFDYSAPTRIILDQMKNFVFVPDPGVLKPQSSDFYERIGLAEEHIHAIAEGHQKGDYFFVTPQYSRMLSVRVDGEAAIVLGRTSEATEGKDKLMAMTMLAEGVEPGAAFLRRWIEYARQVNGMEDAA